MGSSTSTLDNTVLDECILPPADKTLQNSDEHIQTLLEILLEGSPATLYDILKSLGAKDNNVDNNNENYRHLAKAIAKMTTSNLASSVIWDSEWMLPISTDEMSAKNLANTIVTEVFSALHKVPFSALAQAACHFQSCAITELFVELEAICLKIRRHIGKTNEPKDKYGEALQLIDDNPLASWVISWAVSKPWPPENQPDLSFVLLPIQRLFTDSKLPLIEMLQRLLFLEVIYEEKIESYENFTWTNFDVLERIIGQSPTEVAKMFTDADDSHFRQLCPEDFKTSSPRLSEMSSRWSELAGVVKACCIVYGNSGILDLLSRISKCLIDHRNYYSATAFLTGIQNAKCCPNSLLSSMRLNRSKNKEKTLSELLKFKSYKWDQNVDVHERCANKLYHQLYALATSAFLGAKQCVQQYVIGCSPFADKSPLPDIEKGSQGLAKSIDGNYDMDFFPRGRALQAVKRNGI
ncbi:hypothetical protein V496_00958 [Pseudogymnoascus sp. VKM F-4515 (FW-2607)]|nr:hypothetical protein V496_00958 [Pseudogymnoascus sp. VKM F-4515 (FW-2607)]